MRQARYSCYGFGDAELASRCSLPIPSTLQKPSKAFPLSKAIQEPWELSRQCHRPHFWEGDDLPGGQLYPALTDPSLGWKAALKAEGHPCLRSFCPNRNAQRLPGATSLGPAQGSCPQAIQEPVVSQATLPNPFLSICPSMVPLLWCQHKLNEKAADVPLISIYSRF